ncbi:3-deoxy-D-manno-octulosonate 8-phosphate phosphatase [Minicystis rosea]|nr:3-deoxy-D-manno-octulosonate 8-phosphate phosphatase [Minicystis rosea]
MNAGAPLSIDELVRRARRIKLVVTDCDGVLTDTGVYYSERGEELKRFSIRDGMGFERLRDAGISIAIMTGEMSGSVARRAEKLKARALLGVKDKATYLETVLAEMQLSAGETAYIGDDVNDLAVMRAVASHGLVATPADAMPEVKAVAHYLAAVNGGHGAFRDFAEWILRFRREDGA